MTSSPTQPTIRGWILVLAVVALAIAAFLPALPGDWIYDDHPLIANNPYAHSFAHWQRWFTHDFWYVDEEIVRFGGRVVYWRPAISASYALDWTISDGAPLMFHLTNTIAHAVVAGLSFVVLRRWIGVAAPAAIAAALFAVHPTKAESVAWIAGRTDVFCMIGMLVATIGVARRLEGKRGGLALELAGTAAAYLCKEHAIVLPAFVLVEVWVTAGRPAIDLAFVRRAFWKVAPQAAFAVAYLVVRSIVLPVRTSTSSPPGVDHLLYVLESIGRYLALAFAPVKLSIQHGLVYSVGDNTHATSFVVVGALGIAALVAAAWFLRKRIPAVTLGIVFFGVALAPTANIIYTGMVTLISERFLYIPFLGIAFAIGSLIARAGRPALLAGLAIALVLAVLSARRSADYVDEGAFWDREIAMHPESREARQFMVAAAVRAKRYEKALVELLALQNEVTASALGVEPVYQVADVVAQLIPDLEATDLAAVETFVGHVLDADVDSAQLAVRNVQLAVPVRSPVVRGQLARIAVKLWTLRANLASRQGGHDRALAAIDKARALCDECVSVRTTQALVLGRAGRIEDGLAVLATSLDDKRVRSTREHLLSAREHRDRSLHATGPAQLQGRASELAALELWGAAYTVLAPHVQAIKSAPGVAEGFAELAFRAGKPDVAREVLAAFVTPDEIEQRFTAWAAIMGWRE